MSISLSLEGQVALVTGASSGLGPAIARRLDEAGASVCIHYHSNEAGARDLSASLTNRNTTCQADLGDLSAVAALFQHAVDSLGPVSVLVNCAAAESQNVKDLIDIDADHWADTQQTNVGAPLVLMQSLASQETPGCVINISSIEGSRPAPGHGHYATSKAALEMLTRAAALEFGEQGIRVNAIAPGLIHRDGIEEAWPEGVNAWMASAPLKRLVQPAEIAAATVFLASDAAASISGTVLTIDSGLSTRPGW